MLTDDDLTRELRGAYRAATDGFEYDGVVPSPRRTAPFAVPLATTAAVTAVLAGAWALAPDDAPAPPAATETTGPTASTVPSSPAPQLVTDTIEVAGFAFSYHHLAGAGPADDLHAVMNPGKVPGDAMPLDAPEGVKAWVGKDPASGERALYVQAPTRNGGRLFALLSPTWTTDELTDLFQHGRPRPVPAVTR